MFAPFKKRHILIAHRGYRAFYPENTILAFERSLGKFDMFEFDVQYTKDLKPIVFHDEFLSRCSNAVEIFKKDLKVKELEFSQIKTLDNVSWFIRDNPFNIKIPKEVYSMPKNSIPHLDEVLRFIKQKNAYANLEIKPMDFDEDFIVEDILKRIKEFNLQKNIIISSFNHRYIKKIKNFYKAALFEESFSQKYAESLNVDAFHISKEIAKKINPLDVKVPVNVYTVNFQKQEFFKKGFKGLFCDL
jgi:glycerophosphoryl diester phosphodiesterase